MIQKRLKLLLFIVSIFLVVQSFATKQFSPESQKEGISVVVIDPGHGGRDLGASFGNAVEKNIVLDIALKLGTTIKDNYPNIKVVFTRTSDIFIPLYKRAEIANKNEADLFISIHVNAVNARSVQGTETFVLGLHRNDDNLEVAKKENAVILLEDDYNTTYEGFDPNLPESYIMFETMQEEFQGQSVMLASSIQNEFRDYAKRLDRSVKMAGFLVLRETTMPSVLIETGFISHNGERQYLTSEAGRTRLAYSIFRAFKEYKSDIEQRSSFHLVTENNTEVVNHTSGNTNSALSDLPLAQSGSPARQQNTDKLIYSVQIMALTRKIETTPANFKGEQNIFRIEGQNLSRYFSGNFKSIGEAEQEQNRISTEYPNAFVVALKNNKLISIKKLTDH
ncbi:N-acetylmuramoyl-L-alanine amidase family protein [Draconibacterium halophilum]|uniref:N-acetylmuramoyl-L-alanine amidase n=1 Tax=Draconibacterium halophilum TaxID=2706887 RepID=A0A6C0RC97_9BACT|nr:N-acetylmuramoyl-L-alanine amidase [Draconibacterium halophilum]QIA08104.1 N-acetylmuramoyl-L-alanine amidase [Draconibacterium halophilum]